MEDTPARTPRRRNPHNELARSRIATQIWRLRQRLGVTQIQLADRWGVSQATLSRWEAGTQMPQGADLIRIAHEAGIPVTVLTGETEGPVETTVLPVLRAIGGAPRSYTVAVPSRFARPETIVVEVLDGSAGQIYPPGALLFCEPIDRADPGTVALVDTGTELRVARAATDEAGIVWMGLGTTARGMAPLPPHSVPTLRPYAALMDIAGI